jgi:hypothetical protein
LALAIAVLAGALALAALGCEEDPGEKVVARIGDRVITVQMFSDRVRAGGPSTVARAKTPAGRRSILESMIKHEMLLAEAERRNVRGHREVRDTINPILSKRLLEKEFEPTVRIEDVPEQDVRAIYEERSDEFHMPETWRLGVIQTADRAKAEEVMGRLKLANNDEDVFEALATTADNIDENLRRTEGMIGYLPLDDLRRAVPEDLRPHFERIRETDEVPEIVETPRGVFIIMMTGHRPALDRSYESVQAGLKQQALRDYRERKLGEFVAAFRRTHKVSVNYELLGLVRILPPEKRTPRARPADAGAAVERDAGAE